jgi:hypothetical protein
LSKGIMIFIQPYAASSWGSASSLAGVTAAIAEYQAGSPIERATYPENYAALRQRWIDYWEESKGSGDMARDFFEVMLRPLPTPKKYDESLSWGLSSVRPERNG